MNAVEEMNETGLIVKNKVKKIWSGSDLLFLREQSEVELKTDCFIVGLNLFGFYLKRSEPFVLPDKLYGDVENHVKRILKTWHKRDKNSSLGVLLQGLKGAGKSLTLKYLAVKAELPIIKIENDFSENANFSAFLQDIHQPAVLVFDEFAKIFDENAQTRLLSLLEGSSSLTDKLFIFTANEDDKFKAELMNRPGRIRYNIVYSRLAPDVILDYINTNLNNEASHHKANLVKFTSVIDKVPFDILRVLVDETNIHYEEKFDEIVSFLNIKSKFNYVKDWNLYYDHKIEAIGYVDAGSPGGSGVVTNRIFVMHYFSLVYGIALNLSTVEFIFSSSGQSILLDSAILAGNITCQINFKGYKVTVPDNLIGDNIKNLDLVTQNSDASSIVSPHNVFFNSSINDLFNVINKSGFNVSFDSEDLDESADIEDVGPKIEFLAKNKIKLNLNESSVIYKRRYFGHNSFKLIEDGDDYFVVEIKDECIYIRVRFTKKKMKEEAVQVISASMAKPAV